jgi:hypothetical protein
MTCLLWECLINAEKITKRKKVEPDFSVPFFNPVNWIKRKSKRIPFINLTNWWCDKTTWHFCVSSRSKMMHLFWFFLSPVFSLSLIQFYRLPLGVMSRACRRPPPSSFPSSFLSPFLFLWIDDNRKSVVRTYRDSSKWPIRSESRREQKNKIPSSSDYRVVVVCAVYDIRFRCQWVCVCVLGGILGSWITRNCGWKSGAAVGGGSLYGGGSM